MAKRRIFCVVTSLLVLLISIGLVACGEKKPAKEIDTLADAKIDSYESAEELESAATVVVRVEKTEKEENVVKDMGVPNMWYGYTKSLVKVTEIMKNTSGRDIEIGDELLILENQFTYTDEENTNVTCHVNQYKMMEPGKEYFLYLRYSEHDSWYVILSSLFGKVPVSETEEVLFPANKVTTFTGQPIEEDSSTKQILEKIREESLDKYGE